MSAEKWVVDGPVIYEKYSLFKGNVNSHGWPRQNFSLQYQDDTIRKNDGNKEIYQFGGYWLIQYLILWTNIKGFVWQTVRRIDK